MSLSQRSPLVSNPWLIDSRIGSSALRAFRRLERAIHWDEAGSVLRDTRRSTSRGADASDENASCLPLDEPERARTATVPPITRAEMRAAKTRCGTRTD